MVMEKEKIKLLLVDDSEEFRTSTSRVLKRRGFEVVEARSGMRALELVGEEVPDLVLLDLKMPGLDGLLTLKRLREKVPGLPVIILTGHGDMDAALAGIQLEVVDFLNKPMDIDMLALRIRSLLEGGKSWRSLKEKTITELMIPIDSYPKLYLDRPVEDAVKTLWETLDSGLEKGEDRGPCRSALVFNRQEDFVGVIRFQNLLRLVIPPFMENTPYSSYFTGMFLAQCKLIGKKCIEDLIEDTVSIEADGTLIEAVDLMVSHHLVNLPVMERGQLTGILRERDLIGEIAQYVLGSRQ